LVRYLDLIISNNQKDNVSAPRSEHTALWD
jgi:hypothetical protein